MQRARLNLAQLLLASVLGAGCAEHHRVPDDTTQDPLVLPTQHYDSRTIRSVPACGVRLDLGSTFTPRIDFGADWPRAHWQLAGEGTPLFRAPEPSETVLWRGASASTEALHCSAIPNDCQVGGSRLELEDSRGRPRLVHVHFEREQLPEIAPGTALTLEVDLLHGLLVLKTADDAALLLAISRYGGNGGHDARSWTLGPFTLRTDRPICTAVSQPCNHRLTALALLFEAAGTSLVLQPGSHVIFEHPSARFRLTNDMTSLIGSAVEGEPVCAVRLPALDAFSILRE